jgi:hypothetical protein
MATSGSDTLYHGLAHAAPPPTTPRRESWLQLRWQEWLPLATIEARKCLDPAAALAKIKTAHRSRLLDLLSAKVSWDAIRRHRLDSPLISTGAFEFQLHVAVERRRTRMGRVRGVRRPRGV